jgi:hypothetical protein
MAPQSSNPSGSPARQACWHSHTPEEWKHTHCKKLLLKDQFKRIVIEITRGFLPIHVETLKKTLIEEVIH